MSPPITRRQALTTLAGASVIALNSRLLAALNDAAVPPPPLPKAPTMFRHSVCRWCYSKIPLEELARSAAQIGLQSIELLNPDEWPIVQRHGLTCAMANGTTTIPRGFNRVEHHAEFVPSMIERLAAAKIAGLPNVIVFSGNRAGMSDEQGLENCAAGLKQIMSAAEKQGVNVCMELLNSKVDHPDYMCDHTAWGVELVKRVGSERFKLLYDIYHMQIMEGDVIRSIQANHPFIGHYHTGGNPGRHEIDETQELNYPAIMRAIKATGFTGYVAQEFIPTRDPLTSLTDAVKRCSV